MSASLYNLLAGVSVLEGDHGLDECEAEAILDEYLTDLIPSKIDAYGRVAADLAARDKAITDELDRLKARRSAIRASLERMKLRLVEAMQAHDVKRLDGDLHSATLQSSAKVEVLDAELLTDDLVVEVPASFKPDKNTIKQYLKTGVDVPGAVLVTTYHARIR